ncbi:IclR family transcriptional regulator [Kitasatospora phosalacinea]|uniref:IclR family transcriptional regulator n=1 Tax=Kitasatospora phosalacinea TaxID=2065 RepID=A0A9W6QCN8_9ACTN|nr:IclR family transcriptional regulator [Kitasatospora phosalacinea]GLW72639.1 IclR family transcriptional regulator [Kitasatospora phosalacinea]
MNATVKSAVRAAATAEGLGPEPHGAVAKSVLVLDTLPGDGNSIGLAEIARRTGLPKTTVHRILGILTGLGLAGRHPTGYRLGDHIPDLVKETPCVRTTELRERMLPYLLDLHRLTDEAVHFGVLRDQGVLCLERLHGHRSAPLPVRVGRVLPAHATALGKVLLAFTDESAHASTSAPAPAQGGVRAHELAPFTARTLTRTTALARELATVRTRGIALDHGEFRPEVHCLAAPVWGPGRVLVGAVSTSWPANRLCVEEAGRHVRLVAHAASRALGSLSEAA